MSTDTAHAAPPDDAGIAVLIVDDHAVVRNGLEMLIGSATDMHVVGLAADGEQAVELAREHQPRVVLMDLSMPRLDGVAATRLIRSAVPGARVVVLTSFGERERVLAALDAGAAGYLLKDCEPDEVLRAVRAAAEGSAPLDPRAARVLLDARSTGGAPADLTPREREVLALLGDGLPNKRIAQQLGISEKTVKAHITRIFHAIGVTDRTQAALWVARNWS